MAADEGIGQNSGEAASMQPLPPVVLYHRLWEQFLENNEVGKKIQILQQLSKLNLILTSEEISVMPPNLIVSKKENSFIRIFEKFAVFFFFL